jgi:signal transduction histidine kinase
LYPLAWPLVPSTTLSRSLTTAARDEGAGRDEASRKQAFDQFYRSEHARKVSPDGSGVGLYAARGLIEAMGGSIKIDSELGRGTTVTLAVPAEPTDESVG